MTTPLASFSGLATGIDTASLIEQLVALERRPITQIQDRQSDLNRVSGRLSTLRTQLDAVKTAAEAFDGTDSVLTSKASSSDEDNVVVSSTGNTPLGSYALEVTSLATAERTYSDAFSSRDTALSDAGMLGSGFAGGTLSLTVGSDATVDIALDASDTLESIVSKINSSDADVSAGILFDGTNYRMQVTGLETGADQGITFAETGTDLDLGFTDVANQIVAATDATFTLDNFAMTRPTNSFDDAISGLTLELKGETSGPISLNVERDSAKLGSDLQGFVDRYNEVTRSINSEFAFNGTARLGDSLSGDSTLRGLQARMRSFAGSSIGDLEDPYNRLRSIGISTESDGTLSLDTAELDAALADDPLGVSEMLSESNGATFEGFMTQFVNLVDEYTLSGDGILSSRIDSIGRQVRGLDDSIERMERRVEGFETQLRNQFTNLEVLVSDLTAQGNALNALFSSGG